eukprot:6328043-Karenia_brevis.AAC.1
MVNNNNRLIDDMPNTILKPFSMSINSSKNFRFVGGESSPQVNNMCNGEIESMMEYVECPGALGSNQDVICQRSGLCTDAQHLLYPSS